jgi:hypothetical protein
MIPPEVEHDECARRIAELESLVASYRARETQFIADGLRVRPVVKAAKAFIAALTDPDQTGDAERWTLDQEVHRLLAALGTTDADEQQARAT